MDATAEIGRNPVISKHQIRPEYKGGCKFMAAWVREEGENASNQRQKEREAEEADKVEVAPGVTVASLRRFPTALIGPTQGLPKRRRLCSE